MHAQPPAPPAQTPTQTPAPTQAMHAKTKAWIVFAGGTKFGEGRARLLQLVEELGSLNRAVHEMGMSYRAAWGYLKELEEAAGFALVERDGHGMRLTDAGRLFLQRFDAYRDRVAAAASAAYDDVFSDTDVARTGVARTAAAD